MNRFRANPRLLAPLIAGLAMLGPFSIDTIFPAFPVIEADFGISRVSMQQTVSAYLAAFALMSLMHGPLSDAYGRRGVVLISLVLFLAATLGCALAPNLSTLLVFRGLQGISAGAGMIVGRAIVRDRFEGADAQRLMSQVTLIFGVAPAIAPIIGGFVLGAAGWRMIFWLLALFTLVLGVLSLGGLPETLPRERRVRLSVAQLAHTYAVIAGDRRFLLLGITAALNFGALFVYVASAPRIVFDLLHLNQHQFGWLFVPIIAGMMLGAGSSGMLAGRLSTAATVRLGYALLGVGAILNLAVSRFLPPSVPWSILPMSVGAIGVSLTFPTLTLLMLDRFPAVRGAAASVQAALALSFNVLVSGLLSPLLSDNLPRMAAGTAALWACSFGLWRTYLCLSPSANPQVLLATSTVALPNDPAPDR